MCNETNRDIRLAAAGAGIRLWQVARELGITDSTFSRMLREELSPEEKQNVIDVINHLAEEG